MSSTQLDSTQLLVLLDALGAHLEALNHSATLVVVGGAALSLRGWVQRTTHDVDVIAGVDEEEWGPPDLSGPLREATEKVARDFNRDSDWLNGVVAAQWKTGVPDCLREDVEWHQLHGLRLGLAGRQALITLKLFAAVDSGPKSVHLQDLVALAPSDAELEPAREWVEQQDLSPAFPSLIEDVLNRVRRRR